MSQHKSDPKNPRISELVIQGIVVRITFSQSDNLDAPHQISEILKEAYLQKSVG